MRCTPAQFRQAPPIAQLPQWLRSKRAENPKLYPKRLTHLTSENLCDDVLKLLKPTLPPPGTCDIIDYSPGPGVWSQKLNDLVQPRRHVLVEPRLSVFADCLRPLLLRPNSSFRYASSMKQALDSTQQLLSEDTYRFQDRLGPGTPARMETNPGLLVTANLSGPARKMKGFSGSEARLFLNDFYHSIFRDDFTHKYGLVRLLAWIPEDSKRACMPTSISYRTKQSIQLEATCDIEQVAGPSQFSGLYPHQQRFYELDLENQKQVRKLQKELGIEIPSARRQPEPTLPFTALEPIVEEVRKNKNSYPYHQVYIQRLLDLDQTLEAQGSEWYKWYRSGANKIVPGKPKAAGASGELTSDEKEYRILMNQLRTHHTTYLKTKDFVWELRRLHKKIQKCFLDGWFSPATGLPAEGTNQENASIVLQEEEFMRKQLQHIKRDTRALIRKASDDYRCFDSEFPIMAWNRRRYEPLLVQNSEFFFNEPLSLFDIKPRPSTCSLFNTFEKLVCFDFICTQLMSNPGDSVKKGIGRLVPAGLDQFLERIPELKDATKGGWWNLDHVQVRVLHPDLFIKMALAFHDWPHRPAIPQLLSIYKGVFD